MIDDDPGVREVVRYLFQDFGYECETAADGPRGLARFEEGGWDLVLTDLGMPEMSGWEVVEAIRRQSRTTPIVLITGLIGPEVIRRSGELGLPVVPKPFRSEVPPPFRSDCGRPWRGRLRRIRPPGAVSPHRVEPFPAGMPV